MYSSPFSIRQSWKWFVFTFLAGSLNAGAFIACGKFVTHTTGSMTLFGVQLVENGWTAALGLMSLPIYFLLGAVISALLVDRRILQNKRPFYWMSLALVSLCLLVLTFSGEFGFYGDWSEVAHSKHNFYILLLLSLASGLQNATISTASAAAIRTTHVTGITTDLGIGIVRILCQTKTSQKLKSELRLVWLRLGTLTAFAFGAAVGTYCYLNFGYHGFWLPTLVSLLGVGLSFQSERKIS